MKAILGLLLLLFSTLLPIRAQNEARSGFANFDKRREAAGGAALLDGQQAAASDRLKQRNPGIRVDWNDLFASPRFILNEIGFLSGPDGEEENLIPGARPDPLAGDPHRAVKRFLNENSGLFGFDAAILPGARVSREFITTHNGLRTVVWEQQLDGIPVFEAVLYGHIGKNEELVSLCSQFLPALAQAADAGVPNRQFVQAFPSVSAQQAVAYAATNIGESLEAAGVTSKDFQAEGTAKRQRFEANPLLGETIASLVWLPMNRQAMRLCWCVVLTGKTSGEMFQVLVDAETGEVQVRHCWTFHANPVAYRIFPGESPSPFSPGWSTPNTNQPPTTNRVLITLPALSTNASPDGWITPGRSNTIGNNVDAHTDWFKDNPPYAQNPLPDGNAPRPTGTTNNGVLTFDFPLDLTNSAPTTADNQKAAQVHAFYWANWMHDKLYDLGFTEAAGNFQQTNFGRGGVGGDAVLVDVQDAAGDLSNINGSWSDATPQDGMAGRIYFNLFTSPAPDRDSAFDEQWFLHEYTHLMTGRLAGHGVEVSTKQSGGLNEGWSDFFSLALLAKSGDDTNANYAWGAWAAYRWPLYGSNVIENYYYGARRYPYTTQLSKNPLTLGDADELRWHFGIPMNPGFSNVFISNPSQFNADTHLTGQIWCTALWEARSIYISKYGFSNGTDRILRLVMDGMKLGPANPTFLQSRDAILLADRVTTGGVDQTNLWTAFAKRGMGWSAICPGSHTTDGMVEAFDLPPPDRKLWAYITGNEVYSSPAIGPDGTIYVGSKDSKLYAINPDGTLRWTVSGTYSFDCSPAVGLDGTVYMGANDGYLRAIANGVVKWAYYLAGAIFSSPAIGTNGTIYVGVVNVGGNIVALSPGGTQFKGRSGTFRRAWTRSNSTRAPVSRPTSSTILIASGFSMGCQPSRCWKWAKRRLSTHRAPKRGGGAFSSGREGLAALGEMWVSGKGARRPAGAN